MSSLYYEDFDKGMVFETPLRTITDADILLFAGVSGDFTHIHLNKETSKESLYRERIAHGMLTLSMASGGWFQIGILKESIIALYGLDRVRFIAPVYVGDTLFLKSEVIDKYHKKRWGIVVFKNEVFNQRRELVMVFNASIVVAHRQNGTVSSSNDTHIEREPEQVKK